MIIDALGLSEYIIIIVDTEEAFTIAPYRALDPKIDVMLKRVMIGGCDVYGISMTDNGKASPWAIINRLRELGYDVKAEGYVKPKSNNKIATRVGRLVF
ncbi:hypothetical protein [Shewanella xiamenensis]|uniref:hypothetical protein n=1 Tax=Shewanella xiamenensis TaxID=332186 RepID=UPI0011851B48|nr:hypothetical protein [Shewanella xiamenensis]TVL29261.1 hypothetical protein AYI95_15905 [Shewanella xiamenensis]